jgi:hypothetical protein
VLIISVCGSAGAALLFFSGKRFCARNLTSKELGKLVDPMSNILKMGMGCTINPVVFGKVNNNVI